MKVLQLPALLFLLLAGCSDTGGEPSATAPTSTPELAEVEPAAADTVAAARADLNLDERGRALRGYDPVAYFTEGRAVQGEEDIATIWEGATYLFASEAHRDAFLESPERYLPAHGGFCTFGIVLEKKFDGDPEVWLINDDQLHIFLNEDVQKKFLNDEENNFARVEANWPEIRDTPAQALEEAGAPGA